MYLFNPNRIYILIVIKGLAAVSLSLSPSKSTFDSFFGSKDPLGSRPNPCTTVCKTKNRHYSLRIKNRNRNIPIVSVSSTQKYRFRNLLQMRHIFQCVYTKKPRCNCRSQKIYLTLRLQAQNSLSIFTLKYYFSFRISDSVGVNHPSP